MVTLYKGNFSLTIYILFGDFLFHGDFIVKNLIKFGIIK